MGAGLHVSTLLSPHFLPRLCFLLSCSRAPTSARHPGRGSCCCLPVAPSFPHREEQSSGSGPGCPRSSCCTRWLELSPGPSHDERARLCLWGGRLSRCLCWQSYASGPGTVEKLSVGDSSPRRQGALGPEASIHLPDPV